MIKILYATRYTLVQQLENVWALDIYISKLAEWTQDYLYLHANIKKKIIQILNVLKL